MGGLDLHVWREEAHAAGHDVPGAACVSKAVIISFYPDTKRMSLSMSVVDIRVAFPWGHVLARSLELNLHPTSIHTTTPLFFTQLPCSLVRPPILAEQLCKAQWCIILDMHLPN